jgi:putative Ca2+/H+ antiporter (TMEM165/GDT1 family)
MNEPHGFWVSVDWLLASILRLIVEKQQGDLVIGYSFLVIGFWFLAHRREQRNRQREVTARLHKRKARIFEFFLKIFVAFVSLCSLCFSIYS